MKKMNITIENEARQFAFVKGNRAINAKTVKAKENSIKEYGQLSPIIVVKGEDVYLMDGHLVDLDGNDIPDDQTENYYAVLDGQMCIRDRCRNVDCGTDCRNEYLHKDVDGYGLYGGSCNDARCRK